METYNNLSNTNITEKINLFRGPGGPGGAEQDNDSISGAIRKGIDYLVAGLTRNELLDDINTYITIPFTNATLERLNAALTKNLPNIKEPDLTNAFPELKFFTERAGKTNILRIRSLQRKPPNLTGSLIGGRSRRSNKNNKKDGKDNKDTKKKEKRGGWAPLDNVAFQNYGNLLSATQPPMMTATAFDPNLYAPVSPNTGLTQPISSTVNVPPVYRNVTDPNGVMQQSGGKSKNRKIRGGSSSPSAAPVVMLSDIGGTSLSSIGSVLANATNSVAGYSTSMLDTTNSALNSMSLSGGARRKKSSKK